MDCYRKLTPKAQNIFFFSNSLSPTSTRRHAAPPPLLHPPICRHQELLHPASRAGASSSPPIGAAKSRAGASSGLHSVPPRAGQGHRQVLHLAPVGAGQGRRRSSIQRRQEQGRAVVGASIRRPPKSMSGPPFLIIDVDVFTNFR
jgi:hypothetical protein